MITAATDPDRLHTQTSDELSPGRVRAGRILIWLASAVLVLTFLLQALHASGADVPGFVTWRPVLYAYLLWSVALGAGQVLIRGERGKRTLFVLPAVLFVVAMVVFPLIFGLWIAFSDWNLSGATGRRFNGVANLVQMWHDPFYWNALRNMVWYVLAILVEYAIAFGLALLLAAEIRARKFWRVVFLMPLMLSPSR